jgi:class 3 adenylate cyclase
LLNVLPGYRVRDRSVTQSPIAERLKVGTGVIADHCDTVSVLFADLVGFSERSLVMAADELVALLDEIFSAFDRLVMRRASRRSRRSATPIWWRAGCHNHVGTTSRRSLAWRSRCGTRSRRSEIASPSRYRACGACHSLPLPGSRQARNASSPPLDTYRVNELYKRVRGQGTTTISNSPTCFLGEQSWENSASPAS